MTAKEELKEIITSAIGSVFRVGAGGDEDIFKAQSLALLDAYMETLSEEKAAENVAIERDVTAITGNTPGIFSALLIASEIAYAENHREQPTAEGLIRRMEAFAGKGSKQDAKDFWDALSSIIAPEDEAKGKPKSFKSVAPDKYLIPTGKVPRALTEREKGEAEVIAAHGKTPAVKTSFILHFANNDNVKILGRRTISKFDMAILNGVISLMACGNVAITPAMAYRSAAGWGPDHEVTPKQEEAAQKSIERLRQTFVQIDATEEAKAYCQKRGIKNIKSWKRNGALLTCDASEITQINGKKVKAYLFDNYDKKGALKMPIIAEYAQISGQIATLSMELAEMPVNATESNIILKNYLWVQIEAIKNTRTARRQEIAYEGIYKELGIDLSTDLGRKQAQRAREATERLLQNWKQKGAIRSFATYKKDKKAAGVKVEA